MNRKQFVTVVAAWSCLLHGCNAKQKDWHARVDRGFWAVADSQYPTPRLLVGKELIATIGSEPDFKVNPLEFHELHAKNDPWRERVMNDVWSAYCVEKRDLQQLNCAQGRDKWRDCQEFKECTLWVYDESVHFSKPLHHGDWLYCLFCAKPRFSTTLFFTEEEQVIGAAGFEHDKPFAKRSE